MNTLCQISSHQPWEVPQIVRKISVCLGRDQLPKRGLCNSRSHDLGTRSTSRILALEHFLSNFTGRVVSLSLVGLTVVVSPGSISFQSRRICTAHPGCQLENSLTVNHLEAELGTAFPRNRRKIPAQDHSIQGYLAYKKQRPTRTLQ